MFFGGDDAEDGFCDSWVRLIMGYINSMQYFVVVNGSSQGQIIPTRGRRQGDPLSPYLFLICAEGLLAILSTAVSRGEIHGVYCFVKLPRRRVRHYWQI